MTRKLFVTLTLCLSLLEVSTPTLAQAEENTDEDVLAQLQRQGWKIVKDGVLQRELKSGEVETFVFGVGGFTWKIRDLQAQLRKLQAELRVHPTSELRKAISNHRKALASAQRALALAKSAEDLGEIDLSKVSCTINFAYDATASYKTNVQGTTASASASFGANCAGFSGQAYAYAFAKTYVNGGGGYPHRDGWSPERCQRQRERLRQPGRRLSLRVLRLRRDGQLQSKSLLLQQVSEQLQLSSAGGASHGYCDIELS
jgi:hypothetical protein